MSRFIFLSFFFVTSAFCNQTNAEINDNQTYNQDILCNQSRNFLKIKGLNYENQEFLDFKNDITIKISFGIEDQVLLDFLNNIDEECPIIENLQQPNNQTNEFNWWGFIWVITILFIIILIFVLTERNEVIIDNRK